jgi:hypothetical protein
MIWNQYKIKIKNVIFVLIKLAHTVHTTFNMYNTKSKCYELVSPIVNTVLILGYIGK